MDAESFKKVFLPYHQKLFRIAFRIVEVSALAEDIVQDTYIKLWNKRNDLAHIDSYETYAIIILRNLSLDYLRRAKNDRHNDYDQNIAEEESLSKQIEYRDEVRLVQGLVNGLPEQQRLVMKLKHWDSFSDEEIEQATGLTAINIRVTLSRARKTIREQFIKLSRNEN